MQGKRLWNPSRTSKAYGLLEIRLLKPKLFYPKTGGHYEDDAFGKDDKVLPEWLTIRKGEVPDSAGKNWNEQLRLLSKDESVPNAPEMGWFITTFYEVRGARLFKQVYVRTSSTAAIDMRVSVSFSNGGLVVYYWRDSSRGYIIGLASSRPYVPALPAGK